MSSASDLNQLTVANRLFIIECFLMFTAPIEVRAQWKTILDRLAADTNNPTLIDELNHLRKVAADMAVDLTACAETGVKLENIIRKN